MRVRLEFTVSSAALPALITVRSFGGRLILYGKVRRRRNVLCFCTESRNLIVTVRPFSYDFYEKSYFIKLGRCPCADIRLHFDFAERYSAETLQTFYLTDLNYGFPVEDAELSFSGG